MPSFNRHARRIVSKAFRERGIETYSGSYASEVVQGEIRTDDGHRRVFDLVFLATGVRPGSLYADSGLPTGPLGGLRVDKHLQSVGGEPIFGGGDCISFAPRALQRAGVYSVRQAPVLRDNVFAFLSGSRLREFKPGGSYALILNLGGGRAVFHRGPVAFDGRWAMLIKDRIDRRFMSTVATEDLRRTVT
jgi:NADH dehydrogenase FAD-containing subunit